MRKTILSLSLFAAIGCGEVKIKSGEVNGFTANNAEFGFFDLFVQTDIDADLDGLADDSIATVVGLASDDPTICDSLLNGVFPENATIILSVAQQTLLNRNDSNFGDGDVVVGNGQDLRVDVQFIVTQGGDTVVNAFSNGTGTVEFFSDLAVEMSAKFEAQLVSDLSEDLNGDGFDDLVGLSPVEIKTSFRDVTGCENLLNVLGTP